MPRKILQGTVVSSTNDKTAVVSVSRYYMHPLYKKRMKRTKRYHAHDELNECSLGQVVKIIECKPISKNKTWSLLKDKS